MSIDTEPLMSDPLLPQERATQRESSNASSQIVRPDTYLIPGAGSSYMAIEACFEVGRTVLLFRVDIIFLRMAYRMDSRRTSMHR